MYTYYMYAHRYIDMRLLAEARGVRSVDGGENLYTSSDELLL